MNKRKIIDENGRLFGLISVIDVAVILVVAVTAAAVYARFNINVEEPSNPVAPMSHITLRVTITNMPGGRLRSIREGDLLYDNDNDTRVAIGKIENIDVKECYLPSTVLDGTYVMAHVEDRYDVVLTVEGEGIVDSNGRTYFNRLNEAVLGQTINYYTKTCYFAAVVTEITVHE